MLEALRELVWPTTWLGWLLMGSCVILVVLPPKWDPAIRLKEWNERIREKRERGE